MASIALTFGSEVNETIFESVNSLLSDQVVGAALLSVRPDPTRPAVLLAHIPERTLQQAFTVVSDHPTPPPKLESGSASSREAKISSSTAAAAASGTPASSSRALQASTCSSLNVTPAEAVLLAISCLEKVKVRCRLASAALLLLLLDPLAAVIEGCLHDAHRKLLTAGITCSACALHVLTPWSRA
jgi:hypothetical protein